MKNIINIISGSFFKSIGRTLAYILIGITIAYFASFINTGKVDASVIGYNMLTPTNVKFYDNISSTTYREFSSLPIFSEDKMKGFTPDVNFTTSTNGISFSFCGLSLLENNYYSITVYTIDRKGKGYLHPYYTNYTTKMGIGNTESIAMADNSTTLIAVNDTVNYSKDESLNSVVNSDNAYIGSVSYIFKANKNATCFRGSYSTDTKPINWVVGDYTLLGYNLENHGNQPNIDSIKEDINSIKNNINNSIQNSTNDINNSINNSTDSINNNIDDMKNQVNNSINSDDDDTTSGKCGIVCKLKGIFTGIINLPKNLWEFIKSGFDSIINLFTPEEKCTKSENLFDHTQTPYSLAKGTVTKLDNGLKVTSDGFYTTIRYYLGVSSNSDIYGTYSLSSNINKSFAKIEAVSVCPTMKYTLNTTDSSGNMKYSLNSTNGTNCKFYLEFNFKSGYTSGDSAEYTDIMLVKGTDYKDYQKFGEEVCEGGGTIFDWFGNFFKGIINGIVELPVKLVTLLIDGLKALFIPSDDFFSKWFGDMSDFMEKKLGFLAYPFTLFLDFCEFFLNLKDTGNYVISFSGWDMPIFGGKIIPSFHYDLGELLKTDYIDLIHTLYLAFVDVIVLFGFLRLCKNKYASIFGGSQELSSDIVVTDEYVMHWENSDGNVVTRSGVKTKKRGEVT